MLGLSTVLWPIKQWFIFHLCGFLSISGAGAEVTKSLITLLFIYEQSIKPQDQSLPLLKTVLLQYLVSSVWHLTFALEIQEKSMFWITQVQGIGLSSIFLRAQHCHCLQLIWSSISYWLFRLDTMISEPDSFASLGKWVKGGSDNFKLPSALDCQATYLNILPDHFKT